MKFLFPLSVVLALSGCGAIQATGSILGKVVKAETTPGPDGQSPADKAKAAIQAAQTNPSDPLAWIAIATATLGLGAAGYMAVRKAPPSQGT